MRSDARRILTMALIYGILALVVWPVWWIANASFPDLVSDVAGSAARLLLQD